MKLLKRQRIYLVLTLMLVFLVGVQGSLFAQGKGRDRNKGKSKAVKSDKDTRGQKTPQADRGKQRRDVRVLPQRPKGGHRRTDAGRQRPQIIPAQKWERNRRTDQVQGGRDDRSARNRIENQRKAWEETQKSERRPAVLEQSSRNNYRQPRNSSYQNYDRRARSEARVRNYRYDRNDARRIQRPSVRNNWFRNYGQYRSQQALRQNFYRKARKDERKAIKRWEKEARRYDRSNYYGRNVYYPEPVRAWRAGFLRSIVVNVAIGQNRGYYQQPAYYSSYDNCGIPYATDYQGPYYQPPRTYQRPVTSTYYGGDPYHYESAYTSANYYPAAYADEIELPLLNDSSVGGFITGFFSKLVALGYNQGYIDAQNARTYGNEDAYYDPYDPYVYVAETYEDNYQDIGYDPYSCLAQNRQYLSEGYEQGYQDALDGDAQFAQYDNGGAVDLVSLLVVNVL